MQWKLKIDKIIKRYNKHSISILMKLW